MIHACGPVPKIHENLSVGYENLNFGNFGAHFTQQMQLCCTRNFKRFLPIYGPKFNTVLWFFVVEFPLDAFKKIFRGPGFWPNELG